MGVNMIACDKITRPYGKCVFYVTCKGGGDYAFMLPAGLRGRAKGMERVAQERTVLFRAE